MHNGHVKLGDLGEAKCILMSVADTFKGTFKYMSPEMILKEGHNFGVDLYGLGALLYEMVFGFPPFYS